MPTVMDASDINLAFIKIYPDPESETNPDNRHMEVIDPVRISLELQAAGLKKGVAQRLFTDKEAINYSNDKNHFMLPFDDPAAADEIVATIEGRFTARPEGASYEYEFACELLIEDNPESMQRPKLPFLRTLGEELSITVELKRCPFHGELDETHIKVPFEAFGCLVRHVYWPKSKFGKANEHKQTRRQSRGKGATTRTQEEHTNWLPGGPGHATGGTCNEMAAQNRDCAAVQRRQAQILLCPLQHI